MEEGYVRSMLIKAGEQISAPALLIILGGLTTYPEAGGPTKDLLQTGGTVN